MFKFERGPEDRQRLDELVADRTKLIASRTDKQLIVLRAMMSAIFTLGFLVIDQLFNNPFRLNPLFVFPIAFIIGLPIDFFERNRARKKLEALTHDAKTSK